VGRIEDASYLKDFYRHWIGNVDGPIIINTSEKTSRCLFNKVATWRTQTVTGWNCWNSLRPLNA